MNLSNLGSLLTWHLYNPCLSQTPPSPPVSSQIHGGETGLGRTWKKRPVLSSWLSLLWSYAYFIHWLRATNVLQTARI